MMSQVLRSAALAAVFALGASAASAVTISFERITSNSTIDGSNQLSLEATDDGARALLEFTAVSGLQNGLSITEIYFSDLAGIFTPPPVIVSQSAGLSYEAGGVNTPGNVPGGMTASPAFVTTAGLVAQANGNNATGINVGEVLVLGLNFASGFTFDDLLAALTSGEFRVALHVRSLNQGESDSFVNTPLSPIPLPAGLPLLGLGLGALALLRRRKA